MYSNLPVGNYHRYLIQANYNITFSKNGYHSKTVNATILNNTVRIENIQLVPINISPNSINEIINTKDKNLVTDIMGRNIKSKEHLLPILKIKKSGSKKHIILQ